MSDSNIHDSGFAGSPIVSYGQASDKNRLPKLLALIAGSFAVVFALFCIWFWFFTSIPIPTNVVALAFVPALVKLPAGAPEVWRSAQVKNSPLPTVLGYVQSDDDVSQEIKYPIPFAISAFSVADLFRQWEAGAWRLQMTGVDDGSIAVERQSPWRLMGFPSKSRGVWLKVWPRRLLITTDDQVDIPEVLEGYYRDGIWKVNSTEYGVRSTSQEGNLVYMTNVGSDYLANFTSANGLQIRMPSSSLVSWNVDAEGLDLSIRPSDPSSKRVMLGLTQNDNLLNINRQLLSDQTVYDELFRLDDTNLVVSSTADAYRYVLSSGYEFSLLPSDVGASKKLCPGNVLASFDRTSIRNLCSWIGICFDYPQDLIVSQQEKDWNFCIQW